MNRPTDRRKRTALERVYRIRLVNMRLLAKAYRTNTDFAKVLDCTPAFITHITGESPIRAIGEKLARDVEVKLGLHAGWLDIPRT